MNRPRLVRGLRIAWLVTWGIAAVLLVALRARSYKTVETLSRTSENLFCTKFISDTGTLSFVHEDLNYFESFVSPGAHNWKYDDFGPNIGRDVSRFTFNWSSSKLEARCAVWLLALFPIGLAVFPWVRYRFSLRTLLIATTIIAVGLGLIVWLR